jgi:leader peptidase (prepilin peptidase)/N-methyltransferase
MGVGAVLGGALVTGLAAALLTGRTRRLMERPSAWLASRLHVVLAVVGGAVAGRAATDPAELIAYAVLALGCALLVVVDLAEHRLPDAIVGRTSLGVLAALGVAAVVQADGGRLVRALVAAAVLGAAYLVLGLLRPDQLGLGDVKFSVVLGGVLGWLGWSQWTAGALLAFVVGFVVALVMVLLRLSRRSSFPFGPCMVLGALGGALWGPALLS